LPHWSPDGTRLAYSLCRWVDAAHTTQENALVIRQRDSMHEQFLTTPTLRPLIIPYGWTPNGDSILASSQLTRGSLITSASLARGHARPDDSSRS
jgi:Tol biopolymer transport system component